MKQRKVLKGAALIGVEVIQDKNLDKLSKVVLFPNKLREANKVVAKMKWSV